MKCSDMKAGDILMCEECGLQLQVLAECEECGPEEASCCVEPCTFECCDKELMLQKA